MTEKTEEIISFFKEISKPFKDREGGPKLEIIQRFLEGQNISSEYIPNIGLIINKQDNPDIVVVSHMDLINKFQKGFENGTICNIDEEFITGALDNTITNAISLLVFKELLLEDNSLNIELFLSEGEEVGLIGMTNYLNEYIEKSKNTFFINLDVTNDGYGTDMSVEYDKPDFNTVKKVQEVLNDLNYHIQGERFCDDMDSINEKKCAGFSFCLPTIKNIHSYKNKAKLESIDNYFYGLKRLILNLKKEENYETFNSIYMKYALKSKNEKKFKKKIDKKKEESRKSLWEYNPKQMNEPNFQRNFSIEKNNDKKTKIMKTFNLTEFQYNERTKFIDMLMDLFLFDYKKIFKDNSGEVLREGRDFLENIIYDDTSFYLNDFCSVFNVEEKEVEKLFNNLEREFGTILCEEKGHEYKFPNPDYLDF